MRFFSALSLFALALPALAMPSPSPAADGIQELTPAPITLAPRTFFSDGSACNDHSKSQICFSKGWDCDEKCICIPVKNCPYYKEFLCHLGKGSFSESECKCTFPTKHISNPWPDHYRRSRDFICPTGLSSCLIDSSSSTFKSECLDTRSAVDSCGGCASEGTGLDCTSIPNVSDVSCEGGACKVYSCDRGFKVENGTACVEDFSSSSNGGSGSRSAMLTGAVRGAEKFWGF